MSNLKITFWPKNSGETADVELSESSLTTGTLRSTFYLANQDAQELLDAMWARGMRPSRANIKWFEQETRRYSSE